MNENGNNPQLKEVDDTIKVNHSQRFYWREIHHSWVFRLVSILMLAGILFYIITVDFMFTPANR